MTSIRPMILLTTTLAWLGPLILVGTASAQDADGAGSVGSITTLTEPMTRQVVQRRDDNVGSILFAGTYSGNVDSFQATSTLMPGMTGTPIGWTFLIDVKITGGYFFGLLRQPAGGFYNLQIRPVYQAKPGAAVSVSTVGVGEVFITAGQSNSTNYGLPTGFLPDPRVSCFNPGYLSGNNATFPGAFWRYGNDPQPALDASYLCSAWPTMATNLANALDVPIGLYSAGCGGTAIANWLPGSAVIPATATSPAVYLFERLTNAIEFFSSRGGVRGVLWIQGETDFGDDTNPATYQADLQYIINQSRAVTGVPIKWMVAQTTICVDNIRFAEKIGLEQAQAAVADYKLTFPGPNADLIGVDYRYYVVGGPLHFNAVGIEFLGGWWGIYVYQMPGFLGPGYLPPI